VEPRGRRFESSRPDQFPNETTTHLSGLVVCVVDYAYQAGRPLFPVEESTVQLGGYCPHKASKVRLARWNGLWLRPLCESAQTRLNEAHRLFRTATLCY